jgi:hypothetical protein
MSSSSTERVRRLRQHRKGDHSLCVEGRCPDAGSVSPAVASAVSTKRGTQQPRQSPARFGRRGQKLWTDLNDGTRGPGEIALIEEACRIADRLDILDRVLTGDQSAWMTLRSDDDGTETVIVIDQVLTQARMHATTLRGLVAELRQSAGSAKAPAGQGGSILDQLAAKRATRLANPAS